MEKTWEDLKQVYRPKDTLDFKYKSVLEIVQTNKRKKQKKIEKAKKKEKNRNEIILNLREDYNKLKDWGNNFGMLRESVRIIRDEQICPVRQYKL